MRNKIRPLIENSAGILLYGIGLNLILATKLGVGAFDTLALVFQSIFNISKFGNALFLIQMMFVVILLFMKLKKDISSKSIALSVLSIFIISRVVNWFGFIDNLNVIENNYFIFVVGFVVLCLGITLISIEDIIISPFDKFVVEFSSIENRNIGVERLIIDVVILISAVGLNLFLHLNVIVTLVTIVLTFGTGPIILGFSKIKFLQKRNEDE